MFKRSIFPGCTDYTGRSLEEIVEHIRDWKNETTNSIEKLREFQREVKKQHDRLSNPVQVERHISHFIDLFSRYKRELGRLLDGIEDGIRTSHCELVNKLSNSSRAAENNSARFAQRHVHLDLKDESMRPLLDGIYQETADLLLSLKDLSNLEPQLRTFVGERDVRKQSAAVGEGKGDQPTQEEYVVKRESEFVSFVWRGKKTGPFKRTVCIDTIYALITNQGKAFNTPLMLEGVAQRTEHLSSSYAGMKGSRPEAEGLTISAYKSVETIDLKTAYLYRNRLKEIEQELERAERDHDQARIGPLREEQSTLWDELEDLGLDEDLKEKRQWDPENQKAQRRLSMAVHRALEKIAVKSPELARHFRLALKPLKFPLSYGPEPPIPWRTETNSVRE